MSVTENLHLFWAARAERVRRHISTTPIYFPTNTTNLTSLATAFFRVARCSSYSRRWPCGSSSGKKILWYEDYIPLFSKTTSRTPIFLRIELSSPTCNIAGSRAWWSTLRESFIVRLFFFPTRHFRGTLFLWYGWCKANFLRFFVAKLLCCSSLDGLFIIWAS